MDSKNGRHCERRDERRCPRREAAVVGTRALCTGATRPAARGGACGNGRTLQRVALAQCRPSSQAGDAGDQGTRERVALNARDHRRARPAGLQGHRAAPRRGDSAGDPANDRRRRSHGEHGSAGRSKRPVARASARQRGNWLMRPRSFEPVWAVAFCLVHSLSLAQATRSADGMYFPSAVAQTETDEYTRYELLEPETASFKIYYEVAATTAGAKFYYNPIRKGSAASDESVFDAMLGTPLHFEVVSGAEARKDPLLPDADLATNYIKVTLARPVPELGQGRLLIVKTYQDPKSYYVDGNTIVFNRPLGIRRNQVVLPPGYEVVALSVPSQILTEQDGRIAISFL